MTESVTALHPDVPAAHSSPRTGLFYGLSAYIWWGFAPVYFHAFTRVPSLVVLGHRVVWSVALLVLLITIMRQWSDVRRVIRDRSLWPWLGASTALIAINWLVFIYAVSTGRIVESSLGFFLNPLVTVVLGMIFLGERLRPMQWCAALIAGAGLAYLTIARGGLPWITLTLSLCFAIYALLRKKAPVRPMTGLFVETAVLFPASIAFLLFAHTPPDAAAFNTPLTLGLLSLAGIVTTVPMLWFIAASRRMPLVTLGFLQFINPTLQFLVGVVIFGEAFDRDRVIAFWIVWVGVVLFILDLIRRSARSLTRSDVAAATVMAEPE